MKERTKNILIAVLIVGLVSMTVAYAALTQVLNINATAKVLKKDTTWNVHFENLSVPTKVGYAAITEGKELQLVGTTTLEGLEAVFSAPGDSVSYTFDVKNDGTINAKVSAVSLPEVASATYTGDAADVTMVKSNLEYSLTYSDGTAIAVNDELASGATRTLKLTITYKSSATSVPAKDVTVTGLDAHIDYVQN